MASGLWVVVTRFFPPPSHPKSLTHLSTTVCLTQTLPHLPPPLALTQAYCSLSAAGLNSDCWLVVEMEKEALGVFIESLIYQNNNNPPPQWDRERERQADFWFHITGKKKLCSRTHFVLLNKVTLWSNWWFGAMIINIDSKTDSEFIQFTVHSCLE